MYPPKNPDEGRAAVSQDNARDLAELIDALIVGRMAIHIVATQNPNLAAPIASMEEECEVIKRRITDYLLVTDPRAGVFKKPE